MKVAPYTSPDLSALMVLPSISTMWHTTASSSPIPPKDVVVILPSPWPK
ncbi:hypothetical protein DA73_0400019775 [Tolypothrix bouteillei VB521301]|uniref:Uncharacterized protein n=1 Tax=Tolypothrix bouteillei VB521301 TaxID=1479485 RepID=A0A8S9T517_9CYAN|nr:hypothetical protein [Tolypothrix bouteillei]KAF3887475.1 hypothetical protein DA73_0400019775 [Tolypothrix bouteillei VB521301]